MGKARYCEKGREVSPKATISLLKAACLLTAVVRAYRVRRSERDG